MTAGGELWLDRDAGPVVRPYALIAGRTRPSGAELGLIDVVTAVSEPRADARELEPEHRRLIELCRAPAAVADLASQIDLPLGVVRILLSDLREKELVRVVRAPGRGTAQESVLRSLLEGLRAL
jgi:DNA-binding transcriptional ArsR family regulator